ncbi:MAG TPA: nitroreductase/quinone reductase family protein [Myxococcota bacterium]|nr:nitroreductase/quinone reductase family protein [Myxococcota bacterium]
MRAAKIAGGVLAALVVAFFAAYFAGAIEPTHAGRPGMRLAGEVVREPISSWDFSAADELVELESRAPWGLAHSVTVVCASTGAHLYVPSVYFEGGGFPESRLWNRNVVRDPDVRIRIDGKLFERRARLVTDEAERARAFAAFAAKYPAWAEWHAAPPEQRPNIAFVRLDPRT